MSRTQALLDANPFPGLRAFKPTEADRFFGRRQQIDELLNLLATRRLQEHRFNPVFITVKNSTGAMARQDQ